MNGPVLYWASETLWYLGLASVFGVGCGLLYTVSRFWRNGLTASRKSWASRINFQTMSRVSVVVGAFFLGDLYSEYRHSVLVYPIAEEHNVAVLSRISKNEWLMRSDEEGRFVYRACPDFPNDTIITVGYIARRAMWQEKGNCRSIRITGLGFWWRDQNNQYREIENARTAR